MQIRGVLCACRAIRGPSWVRLPPHPDPLPQMRGRGDEASLRQEVDADFLRSDSGLTPSSTNRMLKALAPTLTSDTGGLTSFPTLANIELRQRLEGQIDGRS